MGEISADRQAESHSLNRLVEAAIGLNEWVEDPLQFLV